MPEPTMEGLTGARLKAANLVEHSLFTQFIITLIIINAITLGLETSQVLMAEYGRALVIVDRAILVMFTVELHLC